MLALSKSRKLTAGDHTHTHKTNFCYYTETKPEHEKKFPLRRKSCHICIEKKILPLSTTLDWDLEPWLGTKSHTVSEMVWWKTQPNWDAEH